MSETGQVYKLCEDRSVEEYLHERIIDFNNRNADGYIRKFPTWELSDMVFGRLHTINSVKYFVATDTTTLRRRRNRL